MSRHHGFLLPVLLLAGCGEGGKDKAAAAPEPPAVVAVAARQETVPVTVEYVARTEAVETVEVRARVEGVLLEQAYKEAPRRRPCPRRSPTSRWRRSR
jgi:membrane fusion protein, multidrug efflux system